MKNFSFLVLNPDLRAKLLCTFPNSAYAPKARYTGAGPTTGTMLTKPTKSAQPNMLTMSFMLGGHKSVNR